MIDQLITALSKEVEMSAAEIADTIWLALQMQKFPSESVSSSFPLKTEDERENKKLQTLPTTSELGETPNQSLEESKAGIYSGNEQQTSKSSNLSFKVPDAPSLREPLTLARALKPLMRRVPSGRELVLDEGATIQRIADEGLWIPVLKSAVEPWLDLELVVDEAISMQIWRHTIREWERLLKNYGIFRDVRVWGLITDENEQVQIRRGIGATAKNQTPRSPKELIDPTGRRLVLVVSDCVSSVWRNGAVTPVLEIWAKQGSMAIVQMLPKWLWKRTALGRASEVRLRGLTPGVFNQNLIAKEVSLWDELEEETGVKVPVFTLEPDKVATWAQMLSGKGSIWTLGYVFKLDAPVKKERELFNLNHSELNAEQRVQAFRVTASPMARKLAGLLASAPVISLPIVRLIREALLKDSQQVHVAEVFLGGLLKPLSEINADTNPDYVQYDFMDGVRELLVDSVPSQYVENVVDEVSKYVAKKVNLSLEEFAADLRNPQEVRNSEIVEEVRYFATVTAQVLRRLGGEYVKVAEKLEISNRIEYQENNQTEEKSPLKQRLNNQNIPFLSNPFFAKSPVPPEYFIGRTSEITAAFDTIDARSHLAIWGGPGMGKTSYLDKVACRQTWLEYGLDSSPAVIVLFSCQSLYPFTPAKFWAEILTIMDDKLDNEPELQAEIRNLRGNNITNDTLRQAITKLGRKNKFLVLLVDDFDAALETNGEYTESDRETFLAQCRSLAVHSANRRLTMIVTSLQRLNEIGPPLSPNASPWYNHYMYQSLKKFDYQETEQLLSVFPLKLRDGIRNITGSHPTLIQIAGFLLNIAKQQGEEVDINKFNSDFERDTKQIFEIIWKRCNDQQKTLLMLIVLLDLESHLRQKDFDLKGMSRILIQNERSLTELEEQGVIVSEIRPKPKLPKEKEKIYLFTSSIMKKWVIQEIWNTKASEIRKREKVFLNLMSHGQVEEMKKAITWSGQHQDTVVSLLKFGRDILFG